MLLKTTNNSLFQIIKKIPLIFYTWIFILNYKFYFSRYGLNFRNLVAHSLVIKTFLKKKTWKLKHSNSFVSFFFKKKKGFDFQKPSFFKLFFKWYFYKKKAFQPETFSLRQRIFPSIALYLRFIKRIYLLKDKEVLYTPFIYKKTQSKIPVSNYFLNLNKGLMHSMRKARVMHWNLVFTSKISRRRYRSLLRRELYHKSQLKYLSYLLPLILQFYNITLCWSHAIILIEGGFIYINEKQVFSTNISFGVGDLLFLPLPSNFLYS